MKIINKLLCIMILTCLFFNMLMMFPIKVFATDEVAQNTNNDTIIDNSEDEVKPIDELQPYIVSNDGLTEETERLVLWEKMTIEGMNFNNIYYLETQNTDNTIIAFMTPENEVFGVETAKPTTQKKVLAPSSGGLKVSAEGSITNLGAKVTSKKGKINVGFGEYAGALCLEVEGTNTSKTEKYSVNTITLKDLEGNTKTFTLIVKCLPYDDWVANGKLELSFKSEVEVRKNSIFNIKNYDLKIEDVENIMIQGKDNDKIEQNYELKEPKKLEGTYTEYNVEDKNVGIINGKEVSIGDKIIIDDKTCFLVEILEKNEKNQIIKRLYYKYK